MGKEVGVCEMGGISRMGQLSRTGWCVDLTSRFSEEGLFVFREYLPEIVDQDMGQCRRKNMAGVRS